MISLFIDTSYKSLFVGIVDDDKLIDQICMMAEANFSEKLVPLIKKIVDKNNISLDKIDKLFVTVGPGSFTGIRIGLAVCKTLAFALNKRIIPISSLEFMATTKVSTKYKIPFIDARHDKIFAGVYDENNNCIVPDSYTSIGQITSKISDEFTYISYDNLPNINSIIPEYNVLDIIKKHINDKDFNPHEVNPNYLKKTEAEEKFNG